MISSKKNEKNHEYFLVRCLMRSFFLQVIVDATDRLNSTNVYYLVLKESKTWSPALHTLKVELKNFFILRMLEMVFIRTQAESHQTAGPSIWKCRRKIYINEIERTKKSRIHLGWQLFMDVEYIQREVSSFNYMTWVKK